MTLPSNDPIPGHDDLPPTVRDRIDYFRKRFPDKDHSSLMTHLCLLRTIDMLVRKVGRFLADYHLTPPSFGLLVGLDAHDGPMSMGQISGELFATAANATGLIDTLEKHRFVRRHASEADRRVKLVEITGEGRRQLGALLPGLHELIEEAYSGLSRKETGALCGSLHKIIAKLATMGVLLLGLALPVRAQAVDASTLTLHEAVLTALRRHPSLQPPRTALELAVAEQMRLLGSYDTSLSMSVKRLDKKTPPVVFFQTPRTVTDSLELSAARRFSAGTQVSVSGGYSKEEDFPGSSFQNPRHGSKLDLSLNQPLLQGLIGRPEKSGLLAAGLAVRAAQAELGHAAQGLARQVVGAYWELWKRRRTLNVLRASREESREFLETTQKLAKRYEAEKDDLLRAEADVLETDLQVLGGRQNVMESAEELRMLLTFPPGSLDARTQEDPPEPDGLPSREEAVRAAVEHRLDLKARRLKAEAANERLAALAGRELPRLDLGASLGWSGLKQEPGESLSQLGRLGYRTWSLGLGFSYPLGNRAAKADRFAAESSLRLASAGAEELRREIEREVAVALGRLSLASEQVGVTRRLETMQDEILRISKTKYAQGRITSRDRVQAAKAALGARSTRLQAAADFARAFAGELAAEGLLLSELELGVDFAAGGAR